MRNVLVLLLIMLVQTTKVSANDGGTCGDGLTWTYSETTNTLTISGVGEMADYDDYPPGTTPWFNYRENILSVIIEDGVSSLGNNAFLECSGLITVTIPNSVITIGRSSFLDCANLSCVIVGLNVDSIGDWAFYGCDNITDFYCYAENAPKGRLSFFRSFMKNATIHVPSTSMGNYIYSRFWKCFGTIMSIKDDDPKPTKIYKMAIRPKNKLNAMYDLNGKCVQNMRKGLIVIRKGDRQTKKVIMK